MWPDRFEPDDIWLDGDRYRMIRLRHRPMRFDGGECGSWEAATFRQTGEPIIGPCCYFKDADQALAWALSPAHDLRVIFRYDTGAW